jgi:hypothetical protein
MKIIFFLRLQLQNNIPSLGSCKDAYSIGVGKEFKRVCEEKRIITLRRLSSPHNLLNA